MNDPELVKRLDKLETLIQSQPLSRGWLGLSQAGRYTSLSKSTLSRAIQAGKLKASRTSGKILIRRTQLDQFIFYGHNKRLTLIERKTLEDF